MRKGGRFLLIVAGGGMELCWLYAWTVFCMNGIVHRAFPPIEALLAFAGGAWITGLSSGRGWRVAGILALNCICLLCVALWAVHAIHFPHYSFIHMEWLRAMSRELQGFLAWTGLFLTPFWVLVFWVSGAAMARRPGTYYGFCARFDIGIAAFFCLFMLKLALEVKGKVVVNDTIPGLLIIPFFLFSLLAIGISRPGQGKRSFLSDYKAVGTVMAFLLSVILAVGGITLFAVQGLKAAARSTGGVLQGAADVMLPFMERVLVILFSRGAIRPEAPAPSSRGRVWEMTGGGGDSWWMRWVDGILAYGLSGILAVAGAAMLCAGLVVLVRWLISKTPDSRVHERRSRGFLGWVGALWVLLGRLGEVLRGLTARREKAAGAYMSLMSWARRTGCPRRTEETPWEFGTRLGRLFPPLSPQIAVIVRAYNEEVYGGVGLEGDLGRHLDLACRALRSPLHWPVRLRARLTYDPDRGAI